MMYRYLLDGINIFDNASPLQMMSLCQQFLRQSLSQDECKKGTKDMSGYAFSGMMVNRSTFKNRFHRTEYLFDHPKLFILESPLQRRKAAYSFSKPIFRQRVLLRRFFLHQLQSFLILFIYRRYPLLPTNDLSPFFKFRAMISRSLRGA